MKSHTVDILWMSWKRSRFFVWTGLHPTTEVSPTSFVYSLSFYTCSLQIQGFFTRLLLRCQCIAQFWMSGLSVKTRPALPNSQPLQPLWKVPDGLPLATLQTHTLLWDTLPDILAFCVKKRLFNDNIFHTNPTVDPSRCLLWKRHWTGNIFCEKNATFSTSLCSHDFLSCCFCR